MLTTYNMLSYSYLANIIILEKNKFAHFDDIKNYIIKLIDI